MPSRRTVIGPALVSIWISGFSRSTFFVAGLAVAATAIPDLSEPDSAGFEGERLQPASPTGMKQAKIHAYGQNFLKSMRVISLVFDLSMQSPIFRTKSTRCAARQQCQPAAALPSIAKQTSFARAGRQFPPTFNQSFALRNEHFIAFSAVWG